MMSANDYEADSRCAEKISNKKKVQDVKDSMLRRSGGTYTIFSLRTCWFFRPPPLITRHRFITLIINSDEFQSVFKYIDIYIYIQRISSKISTGTNVLRL